MIKMMFAVGKNGEFGKDNQLPWPHLKEDLKRFYKETLDCWVVMGYNTWKSLPVALTGRFTGVITSRPDTKVSRKNGEKDSPNMVGRCDSVKYFAEHLVKTGKDVFIIGGKSLIQETISLKLAEEIIVTKVLGDFESDLSLDLELLEEYYEVIEEVHVEDVVPLMFQIYKRKDYEQV